MCFDFGQVYTAISRIFFFSSFFFHLTNWNLLLKLSSTMWLFLSVACLLLYTVHPSLSQVTECPEPWVLVLRHDAREGPFPSDQIDINTDDLMSLHFASLSTLSEMRSANGMFYFKLSWEPICDYACPSVNQTYVIWGQSSNPVTDPDVLGKVNENDTSFFVNILRCIRWICFPRLHFVIWCYASIEVSRPSGFEFAFGYVSVYIVTILMDGCLGVHLYMFMFFFVIMTISLMFKWILLINI